MSAIAIASGGSALTPATGNINLFVATTGSNSNDGSAAHPFATIQHAVSVALGFDYQGLYQPTIKVANGTYHEHVALGEAFEALRQGLIFNASLIGNPTTPTNCLIAPNDGNETVGVVGLSSSFWLVDGFGLVADNTATSNNRGLIDVVGYSIGFIGTIDFNLGTTAVYEAVITGTGYVRISQAGALGGGSGNLSFQGGGSVSSWGDIIVGSAFSRVTLPGVTFVFNSVLNLGGGPPFFEAFIYSTVSGIGSMTFVNVGNVTGGIPILNTINSNFVIGADPTTLTLPGGAFSPTNVDSSSNIDGNFYQDTFAGGPVDHTSIYRGSWQIHKDSNQTTAGLGLNLYVDDAGTVVPLIALTPAPGNLTFFVATTGSDSNPGTSGSPFATIQHAASVCASFQYQNKFFPTISVANGTYHEQPSLPELIGVLGTQINGSLTGNTGTPTNCVIAPNSGAGGDIITCNINSRWTIDGFSFLTDPGVGSSSAISAARWSNVTINNVDINTGTLGLSFAFFGSRHSNINGGGNVTFQGTGGFGGLMSANQLSNVTQVGTWTFNSVFSLGGPPFEASANSEIGPTISFVNPGNVTGATSQFSLQFDSVAAIGVDPSTITWPGLAVFTPVGIDPSSEIDGFQYGNPVAGQLTDQSTIYRGSWQVFKDTTNVRRYLAFDDGGTIYAKQIGRVPNTQTGTPYVLALSDQDGRVEMSNAGANQLTVPANATVAFPIGTEIKVTQVNTGATTIAGAVGVTVDAAGVVGGQWKSVMLYKRGTNEWVQTNV